MPSAANSLLTEIVVDETGLLELDHLHRDNEATEVQASGSGSATASESNTHRFRKTHEIGIKLLRVKQNVSMSLTNLLAETGLPSPASPSIKYHMSSP